MAKLGDICFQITDGSHNPPAGIENSKHLMLSSKNINDDEITTTAPRFLTDEQFDIENKRTNVLSGDLLMTIVGTVGRVAVVPEMLAGICLQRSVAVIKPNPTIINNRYLMYQLQSMRKFLESEARGVAQKGIYLKQVGDLSVITPPLDEQYRVVDTLDHISGLIHIYQQQLTKLDELIKARFVEMFGDLVENPKQFPCVLLGSIMTVMPQNGLYKPQSAYVQDKFGTPILRIDGFYNGKVTDFNNLKRLCCTDFEKERYLLVENDIVINRVNSIEYLGKCARISGLQEDTVFESNMMRFHLDDSKVNSTYITTVLCSQYIYRQILTRAKKAVNQASINQGDVQSLNVVVPPLSLQNQFADFVAEVDKSKLFAELFAQNACILAENRSK
ncbi:restriction endonuclease subunit S [Faecalibacterium prausnitzii]|uniref:restriction endonuclease subunit S n=1 Tax=Faecalibacterium prausnitzii TaxID=853 RepID=UPI0032B4A203